MTLIFWFLGINLTLKYSKSAKIPLLEDVLNAIKGKGQLIYIEVGYHTFYQKIKSLQ